MTLAEAKFVDTIANVLDRRMEHDPSIVVMGEDVHRLNGGTNGATRGSSDALSRSRARHAHQRERVHRARRRHGAGRPVHPVVEFMYADFMWVAADQLFNQIGKARHMFGGDDDVPLVLRSKVAMGTGYGSQHSMDPAGVFATQPAGASSPRRPPFDYVGLMNRPCVQGPGRRARTRRPVRHRRRGAGRRLRLLHLPVGRAAVRQTGAGLTVITYLAMTNYVPGGRRRRRHRRRRHRPALA